MREASKVRSRNRLLVVCIIAVMAATTVGIFAFLIHIDRVTDSRARNTQTICARQDQIVAALRYIVSEERQSLLRTEAPTPAQKKSDLEIRTRVRAISVSPCTGGEISK